MILVGGENLIDFIQVKSSDGAPIYQAKVGGSPFNTAKAIARQDAPIGYMTPISTDTMGGLIADDLTKCGVQLCADRRTEPTSLAVVSLTNGTPSYQFYRENTAERFITLPELSAQASKTDAKAFQLGSLAITHGDDADTWADFYIQMKNNGLFTSLDPNIRPAFIHDRDKFMERFERILKHTDLLKLSDEDLEWLYPDVSINVAAEKLQEKSSAKLVIVTLGPDGAFALHGPNKVSIEAATVNGLKDTVGAGDTFMATLIATLHHADKLRPESLGELSVDEVKSLLNRASCAAALNCERDGCNPPTQKEISDAVAAKTM